MSEFHALMRLKKIMGDRHGGPSLNCVEGKWVLCTWTDGPDGYKTLASGKTLVELIAAYDADPPEWRIRHPRTKREYVFPRDLKMYFSMVARYRHRCNSSHDGCAAWRHGPCSEELRRMYGGHV